MARCFVFDLLDDRAVFAACFVFFAVFELDRDRAGDELAVFAFVALAVFALLELPFFAFDGLPFFDLPVDVDARFVVGIGFFTRAVIASAVAIA